MLLSQQNKPTEETRHRLSTHAVHKQQCIYRFAVTSNQHEAALEEERSRCQAQLDKLEGLYSNVSASWQRAQRYAEDLEKENKALIQSIVHISEAL